MNVDEFVASRAPVWQRLETLVSGARTRPERLGAAGVIELGSTYRAVVADLAYARRRFTGDPLVTRLERLVVVARPLVYRRSAPGDLREFVTRSYWRRVAERPVLLAFAACLLFGSALASGVWAWRDPDRAQGFAPARYQSVTQPRDGASDLGIPAGEQAALASGIMTNNIQVTFIAFAGGVLLGLGTVYVLLQNGAMLGVIAGLSIGAGNGRTFFALVLAHGILELSCIAVAGAAGLRVGWALVDPGLRTRGEALRAESRAAIEVVLGTAVWLVVAGLVEGFVTPAGLGLAAAVAIGGALGAVYWSLVVWRGAFRGGRAPSA